MNQYQVQKSVITGERPEHRSFYDEFHLGIIINLFKNIKPSFEHESTTFKYLC